MHSLTRYSLEQGLSAALESFPSPSHTLIEGGHTAGEAADYVFGEVTTILHAVSGERGLLRYLAAIQVRRQSVSQSIV